MINDTTHCRAALDWLQCRLDGAGTESPPAVADHIAVCGTCRERFQAAERLLSLLSAASSAPSMVMDSDRTAAIVISDLRTRRRRLWVGRAAALAAAVALAVWLWPRPTAHEPQIVRQDPPAANAEPLPSFGALGTALAAASRRAAVETVEPGRWLLPTEIELPTTSAGALLPDISPLDSARQGLVSSLEPVATSARRAVSLLLRDLPAAGEENKN